MPKSLILNNRVESFVGVLADYNTPYQAGTALVVKPELHLHRAHKGIGPMRPAEGVAGIEHVPLVGNIGAAKAHHPVLAE